VPRWQSSMNYASFTNLRASTNSAHSVDDGKTVSISVGSCRLLALSVMPATEFVCIAVFGLFHSRLLSPLDPAVLARTGQVPLIPKDALQCSLMMRLRCCIFHQLTFS